MQKNQKLAYKYALFAVLFWSSTATVVKIALTQITPVELVFFSSLFSLLFLTLIIFYKKKSFLVVEHFKSQPLRILVLGSINPFIYYLILFRAYDLLPAQEAQAINYTWALMFTYLSVIFLKHKLTLGDILAGFICYFGVLIIATKGAPFSLEFSNLFGVGLAVLSTVIWSMYWIINSGSQSDATVALFCNFLIGVITIGLYILFIGEINIPEFKGILSAIYIGFFEMGITFIFWLKAVNLTHSISKISNLIFLSPFLSLVFIYFFVEEKILPSTLIALFLIISGLILQQKLKARL